MLFARAADLVRQLIEARDTRELTRLQQRLLRVDVLIVDELGFVPFDRIGGELLFNLITDRYERRATVVTTNLAFAEWVTVFAGDEKLTTALLDRLAHHATVITTKGKSYRMRKRRDPEATTTAAAPHEAARARGATIVTTTPYGSRGKLTERVSHRSHRASRSCLQRREKNKSAVVNRRRITAPQVAHFPSGVLV